MEKFLVGFFVDKGDLLRENDVEDIREKHAVGKSKSLIALI